MSDDGYIISPCIGVCQMDVSTGWCLGCGRTKPEIESWKTLEDECKLYLIRKVLKDRLRRMGRWPISGRYR